MFFCERRVGICLGIPMKIVSIDGTRAACEARGVRRTVDLFLLRDEMPLVGDMVMVHVDKAIQKVSEEDARITWALFDEILAAEGGAPGTVPADA